LVQNEHTAAIVFYFSATASVLSLLTLPFGWVVPTGQTAILLISAGLVGGVAQILVTSSYRFGSVSMLAPYDYTSMLFAIILGYVIFGELPTAMMLGGAALVICAGVLVIWREHQLGMERSKVRAVSDPSPDVSDKALSRKQWVPSLTTRVIDPFSKGRIMGSGSARRALSVAGSSPATLSICEAVNSRAP
jgi:uncharacterized membrane protein